MSSLSRQQLETWLKNLDITADKVLDIGGCQLPVSSRLKSCNVKEYLILDLDVPHEQKRQPDIIWDINREIDFWNHNGPHNPDSVDSKYSEYFDIVFMLEILEYVWNPFFAFLNCKELLKKGGKLYLSFHFVYPYHNPAECDFLRYTPEGILKLLEETGFKLLDFYPRTLSNTGFQHYCNMVVSDGMKRCIDSNIIGGMLIAEKL